MEITFPRLTDLFAATKMIEGCTPKTVNWYSDFLAHFSEYVGNGEPARIRDVSVDDVRAFIASLQSRTIRYKDRPEHPEKRGGLSHYTIRGYVRARKAFSAWLHEEGFTVQNVSARLKRRRFPTHRAFSG